jgi:hypothetical protein
MGPWLDKGSASKLSEQKERRSECCDVRSSVLTQRIGVMRYIDTKLLIVMYWNRYLLSFLVKVSREVYVRIVIETALSKMDCVIPEKP